jgi:hypothetical protein
MGEMSILDDAIREHLELKRAHGADEAELQRLEDEAFGPAERPGQSSEQVDPFAEAPTEFLTGPSDAEPATGEEPSGRRINVADLQEPPPPKAVEPEENAEDAASEGPSEEEHPAMEHKTIAEPASEERPAASSDALQPDPDAPHSEAPAEERHAIAEQPTELFDVEGQFQDTAESASPTDEQLIEAEGSEPRLSPVDPLAGIDDAGGEVEVSGPARDDREDPEDEFDEFFSEQRLSDELNQALEAPLPDEPGAPATDESFSPFLDPDAELGPTPALPEDSREHDLPDDSREHDLPEDSREHDIPDEPRPEADATDEFRSDPGPTDSGHVDPLEDTPEFLEESPEDDDAWFEQRPPKDFDFGD